MKTFSSIIASPIGALGIKVQDNTLVGLSFLLNEKVSSSSDAFIKNVEEELARYFENSTYRFKIPLAYQGTPFQEKVWRALQAIPSGETLSYGALAEKLKTSARAIGNACRTNPIALIIPCHRIVSKDRLGGFCGNIQGDFLKVKSWLLRHEKVM